MAIFNKALIFILVGVLITSCSETLSSTPVSLSATETSTPIVSVTSTSILTRDDIPTRTTVLRSPTPTAWPSTPTFPSALPQTITELKNGLTWIECEIPNRDYSVIGNDISFLGKCVKPPVWNDETDELMVGEHVENSQKYMELRISIGEDLYETKMGNISQEGCCHYDLMKNGETITRVATRFYASDPNLQFWIIEGKLVWELEGWEPVIVVDGINYNEEYKLQGSYKPYEVNGKLIYVAKHNEKYQLVYDSEPIGPDFDQISMPNCCGMIGLYRGSGQYWFVGVREGKKFVVSIQ